MTTAELLCASCGNTIRQNAKFCDECGTPTRPPSAAEYKQVTVLFADVVHSMDIASAVGPERLREIMTELVRRSTIVVQRYGGTVDKFTGDGIMALFGAPVALEDHAFRACLAALEIQEQVERLPGIDLQVRIGLNSGQVIAGDVGAGPGSYTAIGEHVGMAQRMESAAPAGGVMLSESTARLVEISAVLGSPEMVYVKGFDAAVAARRLLSTASERAERNQPSLVGRTWEMNTVAGLIDEAIGGAGCVVSILGPAGIGKSRLTLEAANRANAHGMDVVTTYCESHANDVPFHAVARLLREAMRVNDLDASSARAVIRARVVDADPEDLLLLDDLLGIADADRPKVVIEPGARQRRLTALINALTLSRTTPTLFVIEDVHWIDEISESMLAGFLTVIPQSRSVVLLTYRPEYQGALTRVPAAQAVALRPLSDTHISGLIRELLGADSTVTGLAEHIAEKAAGNPFFAEEIVRDLAGRDVLYGNPGAYRLRGQVTDVSVPPTLQATISARIDRLTSAAKQTLSAAAVIGARFGPELLRELDIEPDLDELLAAELIDQVKFTRDGEFAFRHPLVRTVAYESQLKAARAELHRRLANLIESRNPETVDENAALIAEHLEAAGDLHAAFNWHMRAGTWLTNRDLTSARLSWEHARAIADALPADDPQRVPMRIAPRTLLCLSMFRAGGTMDDVGFEELRVLASEAGDKVSLAMAMAGQVGALIVHARFTEASSLASEYADLLEAIGDPTLTVALLYAAIAAKSVTGELTESIRLSQRIIELADGDPTMGNLVIGSPLATALTLRGAVGASLGDPGWRDDVECGMQMARTADPPMWATMGVFKYGCLVAGALPADAEALRETAELLSVAERSGDDFTLAGARYCRGLTLVRQAGSERDEGFALLALVREAAVEERFTMAVIPIIDTESAAEKLRLGDVDGAVELSRNILEAIAEWGRGDFLSPVVAVFVESLLCRGADADLREAEAAVKRLAVQLAEPRGVFHELYLLRLRALVARANGDEAGYREFANRYLAMADSVGFEPHVAVARAM
ncbi:MAG TPA: adenylate/guanylate cyclase domain-containing protein [Mycobacterium sp.]|jgi:adenylate cyclase